MPFVTSARRLDEVPVLPLLVGWTAVWLLTVVTWETDAAGSSVGTSPFVIPFHLLLPFAVGILAGARSSTSPRTERQVCGIAGGVVGMRNFGILLIVGPLWLPPVESPLSRSELVAEGVAWA